MKSKVKGPAERKKQCGYKKWAKWILWSRVPSTKTCGKLYGVFVSGGVKVIVLQERVWPHQWGRSGP